MKALSKPWVSGGLAVLAVAFLVYQIVSGMHRVSRPSSRAAQAPPPRLTLATRPSAPAPSAESAKAAPPRSDGIDRSYVALHFTNWAASARRDPFLLHPSAQQSGTNAPSQLANLKLKAIWHQTGSRVAVLNDKLYEEGDSIEGYKIIRIEDEVVWLQNANSLGHLEFRKPEMPATAATSAAKTPAL